MKTTLVLDEALYRQAKVLAAQRGVTVSSVVDEALRLMLEADRSPGQPSTAMPEWGMGRPHTDLADSRALRDLLDATRQADALR